MLESLRAIASPKSATILLLMAVWGTILSAPARAEGTYQVGLSQPFVETNATAPGAASTRDILVDIVTAGEVINISACGAVDTNVLAYVIETPSGAILPTYTPTALAGKTLCSNPMTAPITTPYRYTTTVAGRYKVRLINVTAANFNRFDITVTANASINPDPTNATGIKGRVSSLAWQYNTGSFAQTSATNADYYVLTPGGYPGTNYVWQLDLNALAGNVYSISANNKGVEAPRSGFSTDVAGNSVVPQFQNYINYPEIAGPPPSSAPPVTGFRFIDNAGQDYAISPGNTTGVQDSGFFQFTAPVDNATYSISIDVNKNGIFGDAGDVRLTGNVTNGFNSIAWDGRNNSGVVLPIDSYQARAEVRLGEFHFIANDVETSGGTQNGLTVYEATSPSTRVSTRVYWDDITVLGVAAGGTANTPLGAVSGTAAGYHTWGTFDVGGGGFGNNRFVDTFAFGATTQASLFVAIVGTDAPLTGSDGAVTITPTSKPGDTLALSVTDADLNSLSGIIETVLVSVINNVTGEMESVTLTETGANTGIFTGSVATTFGAVAGPNNNGVLNTQATDTVTVTYNDALTAAGTAVARTADDVVSGGVTGTVSITPTSGPGDTLSVGVSDADLNINTLAVETIVVTVVNSVTGETEMVTLTETGANTGVFAGTLATTAGLVAGTNNDGTINVKAADTVVVNYPDARAANGGPAAPTATNTTNSYNPLIATDDTIGGIDATLGATNLVNAFNGDLVNLVPATSLNAVLSVASGSSVPAGLTFDTATGAVGVIAGTTAGTYSFNYRICEAANLLNCTTATVTVVILIPVAQVVANNDAATGANGVTGTTNVVNAFSGDTVNNIAATSANATLSVATGFTVPAGLSFDTATGNVSVDAGTAPGIYSFDYQLCEIVNPTNCDIATISVTVAVPPVIIVATADSVAGVNGGAGAANIANAFTGDTIGGAAATTANSALGVATGFTVPAELIFDTATGNVSVLAGVAAGTYSFDYEICELSNPANCQTATITVTVASTVIVATDDTATGVNGASGAAGILNAFTGDTIGGAAASTANAILSVAPGFSVPAALTFDMGTGNISVVAGTAAGTYSFDYQICEAAAPANCQTASVSATVVAAPLVAVGDSATGVSGATGANNVLNVFTSDTINGAAVTTANTTLIIATGSTVPAGLTFDPASGNVSVGAGTPAGIYTFDYQICEILNPANCQVATISVGVDAAALVADADAVSGVNGASGASNVVNVLVGDTVNGAAASTSNAVPSVAPASVVPAGLTFDVMTGNVSVAAGTPAGVYSFNYQICEALNPVNCQTAAVSVTVDASAIVVTADSASGINGASGANNVVNAFVGDAINGAAATSSNAVLSVATGSVVPAGLTFNSATGNVSVAAGTPAGTYSFDYQICEALNPSNCQISTISVTVAPSAVVATADSVAGVNGANGTVNALNVLAGDTVNGDTATSANAILSVATGSSVPAGLTFDAATGIVGVAAGTPAGTYIFDYQICETLNPANCHVATASITLIAAPLVAVGDSATGVNGASGASNVVNAFAGDTINGAAATAANTTLSVAAGSSVPAGLTFDPASGNVSVAAGTPATTYTFDYQTCEILNPANCQVATISVVVDASAVVATADAASGVNGASGAANILNAFTGDTINAASAATANSILSVAATSTVPVALIFDAATGNVSVAAGSAAGTYSFDYQICEALNPSNCQISTISVTLAPSAVLAAADSVAGINGANGTVNALNVLAGDTVNGNTATSANAILSVATGSSVPAGLTFDAATGIVGVAAGTPAGPYSFDYQICEALNPANCQIATASITVIAAPLVATADSATGVNGASGASNVVNAFAGDTINGAAASAASTTLSVATGSSVPSGLTFDTTTGNVSVAAGTPAGTYTFDYHICEAVNPASCQTATISIVIDPSTLVAANVSAASVNGASGAADVVNVLSGSTVNGAAANTANAIIAVAAGSSVPAGLIFNAATGNISVAAGTAAGTYSFDFQICEALNPANCRTATVSIVVDAAVLVAAPDSVAAINGASGSSNVLNVFAGDTLNSAAANAANTTLAIAAGSTVPSGLTFDTATGNVSVASGTPAGSYSFDYRICEILNASNCQIATVSVTVDTSVVVATADAASAVNGASGAANVVNVLTGDTVNVAAASPSNITLSVAAGSNVPAGLIFDTVTGNVSVIAGTPAGAYSFNYSVCEILNPANCQVATVSVSVASSVVTAANISTSGINGASGAADVANVLAGNTVNGGAATTSNAVISVAVGSSIPAGLTFDVATGNVSVASGTPAAIYSFNYQICEALNPANCQTATVSVTVDASAIVVTADSASGINGASGASNVVNAFAGDTINGVAASSSNAVLRVVTGSTLPAGLSFDTATGQVDVAAGTQSGTYSFDYQICEALIPGNCRTSTISTTVNASAITATADPVSAINGASGAVNVVNAFTGDTVNGAAATAANAVLSVATSSAIPVGLSFDVATGNVSVAAGTPAGIYSFDYQICEILNPANCQIASISVTVDASSMVATADAVGSINGATGTVNVLNVFDGDTVNGTSATTANATLSIAPGSTVPSGLTFDPATGNVSVAAGTSAGSYAFDYQICEILNPANCRAAAVVVGVDASAVVATPDAVSAINGASGASNVVNAFAGDTVNGVAASAANAMLSVGTGSSVPAGLTFDPATGIVGVSAGTPAGTYSFDYQLCELLNPTNCRTATVSVGVDPSVLVVTNVNTTGVNGATGAADVVNVLSGSTLNGAAADTANAIIAIASGSSVPAGLVFNTATGNISVAAGTAAGTYSFTFQICEALNPANCQIASASITVVAAPLVAVGDSATGVNGASGATNVVNIFTGDTINIAAATTANTVLSVATGSSVPSGLTFNAASGNVSVAAGTPFGTYTFDYQICEALNPSNCQTATVSVTVDASAIVVTADSASAINGASGANNVVNALVGDTVNGAAATSSNAVLSVATGSAVPAGLTFDTITGNVSVVAGTAAGTYAFDYQICEALNPLNCQISNISVTVAPSAVVVTADSVAGINGANGTANALNVMAGDTVNGDSATTANATLSVAAGSSVPAGLTFDTATGIVGVSAGTPAGTYSFDYQLCELLNPANCRIATISLTVDAAPLAATSDSVAGINGASGSGNVLNVFAGDTLNGVAATNANAVLRVAAGSSVPAGLTFDTAAGNVGVTAGTPAGTYSFDYQICEILNPANCQTASVSITVDAAPLVATADSATGVNGASGANNIANAFNSDTINGAPASAANATLSVATGSTVPAGLTFDTVTGTVSVAAGTPAGTYAFEYQICEILNPANCRTATISVTVASSAVVAAADIAGAINGASGAVNALNVFTGDTVNGVNATPANAILSIAARSSLPAGLTFDPATGNVSVVAGTPAGTYSFEYQICEALNPANCQTATASVTTVASPLSVNGSSLVGINGADGAPDAANILTGNSINGQPATTSNAILRIAPGSSILAGFSLDNATGRVSIAAGTPAGNYVLTYQICEALNPANCSTASINFTVDAAPLLAVNDSISGVNGTSGASNVLNILVGDILNGAPANTTNVAISLAPGSTVPSALTFDRGTGNVSVTAVTPAGTYAFDYQICELLNPTNCRIARVSITVDAAALIASPDSITGINGASGAGNVVNAFTGDTINGSPASAANAVLTVAPGPAVPAGLTFDTATGNVNVAPGTPVGIYTFNYQICEILNPGNCQMAAISVSVDASPVVAVNDAVSGINGASGAANVLNAFAGDTVNRTAALPTNSVLSIAAGAAVPAGLTFDLLTGNVGVAAGTAAGIYSFDYQICETLNPANCKTANISVTVNAAPLVAASDSVTGINGASGASNVVNAFNGDTVNGVAATTANSFLRVPAGSAVPVGLIFDSVTGNVSVAAGTAAGAYSFDYQICELLNPANCRTAAITVTVDVSALIATADVAGPINGASGAANVLNVFAQDAVNGVGATTANASLAIAPGSAVPAGLGFDVSTGNVSVDAGTAAGTYIFEYQLCEILNPANCAITTATVTVVAASLNATADTVTGINGASGAGNVVNAFTGDTLNGAAATPANSVLSIAAGSSVPAGLSFDAATGNVSVAAGTPAGTYVFDYQICELLNPTNCRASTITVSVVASAVIAVDDSVSGIDGTSGAANVLNVFTGDTVNGAAANATNAILNLAPGASVPAGLIFDVANGSASVAAGTAAGTYSFDYQICEALNPANCQIATATVTVTNPAPVAVDDATTVVRGQSVKINVLANDSEPGGETLRVTTATAPANGSAVINGDGTISYTPNSSFVGTDSFTYTICDPAGQCSTATVTITVHPSVSALTGTVFQDMDGNRTKDPSDPRQPNWLIEIVRDGVVVATVRTDANGNYRVSDLPLGAGYSVVFRHPTSNVVYGRTDGVTLNPGITAVDLDRPIDPSGVVYDSVARTAIAGARLNIVDANGALLPVACLLDASQQGQITGADGRYRFDIVPGGAAQCPGSETVYRLVVAGPADTVPGNSTVILPNSGPFDPTGQLNGFVVANIAAPQAGDDTRYFFNFRLASGDPDVVNNHIPLDRAAALNPLVVTKTSVKRTANVGDLVPYTIVVRNTQNIARNAVDIVDLMPAGFKYVANTGRVDANAISPVANGRELSWQNLNLPANGSLTISLVLTVGSGVNDGDYVNIATGRDARNGRVISNEGQATVRIMPSPLFDCGEIIGKVFDDRNGNGYQDDGEPGIAGARVATVNGLLITADQYGRYHVTCAAVPNARIGSNVILKLDPRSLPGGYQITTENPRVVRLTRGKISELNFGARVQKAITLELTDAAFETGGTALRAEWQGQLSGLIADVQPQPSTIRLHYAAASASDALRSDRLKALAEQIQLLWREAGEDSELIIERISAQAKPFNGKE